MWKLAARIRHGISWRYQRIHQQIAMLGWRIFYTAMRLFRLATGTQKTILVYPPIAVDSAYTVAIWCYQRGYRMSHDPNAPFDAAFYWEDATIRDPDPTLSSLASQTSVINYRSRDIRKQTIMKAFEKVFGRPFEIDPTQHQGLAFVKSDKNGTHDGRIIECPIAEREPGRVYQRYVDNRVSETEAEEWRVPVFNGSIPFVTRRHAQADDSVFGNALTGEQVAAKELLSQEEIYKIIELAAYLEVDMGEFDVSRDRNDGQIYVMDLANTPTRPIHCKKGWTRRKHGMKLAKCFDQHYLS